MKKETLSHAIGFRSAIWTCRIAESQHTLN